MASGRTVCKKKWSMSGCGCGCEKNTYIEVYGFAVLEKEEQSNAGRKKIKEDLD